MPSADAIPMQAIDLRGFSSDWTMTCPVHGAVTMAVQFGGDWGRTFCQDCFEATVAGGCMPVTVDTHSGPAGV